MAITRTTSVFFFAKNVFSYGTTVVKNFSPPTQLGEIFLRLSAALAQLSSIRGVPDDSYNKVTLQWSRLVKLNVEHFLVLRQDPPPLDLSFWSFLTFLHHGIEEVERHLLKKFYKKIRMKSWSNVPPKLLACIGFLYKVVHKIGRLRKFNRSREIEFNFLTAWTISMKFGTLV